MAFSRGPAKKAPDPFSATAAYAAALRWLTVRDLSTAQVRDRLARRGYTESAIAEALTRLTRDGTLDDRRAARAVARTEANIRRRGPHRVMSRLASIGIDRDLAKEVTLELFGEQDEQDRLEQALDKRLRSSRATLADPAGRQKLLAYLVRQGFSSSASSALIRKRAREK